MLCRNLSLSRIPCRSGKRRKHKAMLPAEDILGMLAEENPDLSEKTLQNKAFLYPVYRENLTQVMLARYLTEKGFFKLDRG